jgi:hypothetical protein
MDQKQAAVNDIERRFRQPSLDGARFDKLTVCELSRCSCLTRQIQLSCAQVHADGMSVRADHFSDQPCHRSDPASQICDSHSSLQTGVLQEVPRRRAHDSLNRTKPPLTRFTYTKGILAREFDGLMSKIHRSRLLQAFLDVPLCRSDWVSFRMHRNTGAV